MEVLVKRTVNWRFLDKSVSEETIKNIAKEIGIKIPTNYINCAINHHGAGVKPYCFKIEEKKRASGNLLSFDTNSGQYILGIYQDYKNILPIGLVPFAIDPAGNLICLIIKRILVIQL